LQYHSLRQTTSTAPRLLMSALPPKADMNLSAINSSQEWRKSLTNLVRHCLIGMREF